MATQQKPFSRFYGLMAAKRRNVLANRRAHRA